MQCLKINKITLPFRRSHLKKYETVVESVDEGYVITFTNDTMVHGLKDGDTIVFTRKFGKILTVDNEVAVKVKNANSFSITIPKYLLLNVNNLALKDDNAILEFKDITPYKCVNDITNFTIYSVGKQIKGSMQVNKDEQNDTDAIGEQDTLVEDYSYELVFCDKPINNIVEDGLVFVENTWFFKNGSDVIEFDDTLEINEKNTFLTTSIGIAHDESYTISDSTHESNMFLQEIKQDIIPDIIDNEKQQFIPMKKQDDELINVSELVFNLHFRDRTDMESGDGKLTKDWDTTDEQVWNNLTLYGDTLSWINSYESSYPEDYGDELNLLGFTEDDIKYQKMKLKKTFIRLLYYSSNNFSSKELLGYSTIFLDANRLYSKYCSIKNNKTSTGSPLKVFGGNRKDENLRLSASFSVENKYINTKSSEGFYLYLFPDELYSEIEGENVERTIYMKVEFNHAGYGKTILMSLPRENGDEGKVLKADDNNFPVSYLTVDENGMVSTDVKKFNNDVMIPIKIFFDEKTRKYCYYFPWYDRSGEKIIINLWEPRMKGEY